MKKQILGAALIAGLAMGAGAAKAADVESGKQVFKQCMACHTAEAGKNKIGPSLFGVVGRKAGEVEGFKYSKPMHEKAEAGFVWTPEHLHEWITNPKGVVPGTTMAFAGVKDAAKVDDVIAYLETLK